jgi:hypothetical protein
MFCPGSIEIVAAATCSVLGSRERERETVFNPAAGASWFYAPATVAPP